jgi:membrane protein implicated in regulation of membrane protease activity
LKPHVSAVAAPRDGLENVCHLITGAGAGFAAATELVNKLALAIAGVKNLPPEAKWLAAGLLATLPVLALWASRSRRSRLLRPDRFVISADDPEHLVGRDEEVKELAKECEQNALVFLQGESGAGKSALVLGGLLPHYQATRAGTDAPRLLPIRIDASPLSWDNDLRVELARALRDVSAEEQVRPGATTAPGSGDPFSWLAALPIDAPCQVLLVVDQIDDYAVAHQARFVRGHTVVAPENNSRRPTRTGRPSAAWYGRDRFTYSSSVAPTPPGSSMPCGSPAPGQYFCRASIGS